MEIIFSVAMVSSCLAGWIMLFCHERRCSRADASGRCRVLTFRRALKAPVMDEALMPIRIA